MFVNGHLVLCVEIDPKARVKPAEALEYCSNPIIWCVQIHKICLTLFFFRKSLESW